jgi:hypothetical protein
VLLPEDAGQHRVYDGIRKGLELAQMERVCLKEVEDTETSFRDFVVWHATLPKPEPLVFAIGRRAGARLVAAGYAGPGVLVSTEVTAKGEPLAPEPALGPRMARVRAEVSAEAIGQAVGALLGLTQDRRAVVGLALERGGEAIDPRPFTEAAGIDLNPRGGGRLGPSMKIPVAEPPPFEALLHVRLGLDERVLPFEQAREWARQVHVPLVSDDPARFGAGATMVIVPDHQRVGRMAAEAGRRLWQGEPDALGAPLVVRTTEIWVDLVAAQEIGLEPPLTFLAAADRVRAPPRKSATPAPGAPGASPPGSPSTPR